MSRVFVNGTILVGEERAWLEILTAKEGPVPIIKFKPPRYWFPFLPFFLRFQEKFAQRRMESKCRKTPQRCICFLGNLMEWQKVARNRNLLLLWLSWLSTLGLSATDTRIFDVYAVMHQADVPELDVAFLRSGRLNSITRV